MSLLAEPKGEAELRRTLTAKVEHRNAEGVRSGEVHNYSPKDLYNNNLFLLLMEKQYVIVHDPKNLPSLIYLFLGFISWNEYMASKELRRIRTEEEFVENEGSPKEIPTGLFKEREILVCGSYLECCVRLQYDTLTKAGFNARIHKSGSISDGFGRE